MSAFKDAVSKDAEMVFINEDEFADKHVINGREVLCIVDENEINEAKWTLNNPVEGVFDHTFTIYIRTGVLERCPVENEVLRLDGKLCFVRKVSDEMGLLVISVEAKEK